MTEVQWLNEVRPTGMLFYLRDRVSQRKVILFNCACCRRVWNLLAHEDHPAVAEFEANADDPGTIAELERRYEPPPPRLQSIHTDGGIATYVVFDEESRPSPGRNLRARLSQYRGWSIGGVSFAATNLVAGEAAANAGQGRSRIPLSGGSERHREFAESYEQTQLVRDIFGNPFRPLTLSPEWRTSTVVALAQGMYESRAFSAMPILADALQDAGCDSGEVLDHCRGPGPHVRGCWVVDLVLGKE